MNDHNAAKTAPTEASEETPRSLSEIVKNEALEWMRLLRVFIPVLFLFTTFGFEQRVIPSESMVPGLQVGDRVLVNKFSYGFSRYSLPWGVDRLLPLGEGRIFSQSPERGDVIVFMHPHFRRVMIKRLIGVPGDTVEMREEQLYLNGEKVGTDYLGDVTYIPHKRRSRLTAREYRETIGDKSFLVHQWGRNSDNDSTASFIVPEGYLFFMGDNRDNSTDARALSGHCPPVEGIVSQAGCLPRVSLESASVGFVPLGHVIGRGVTVAWTTNRCKSEPGLTCPPKRVWKGL